MRIIGGRDYYDGVQSVAQDRTLVYSRSPQDKAKTVNQNKAGLQAVDYMSLALDGAKWREIDNVVKDGELRYHLVPIVVWFAGKRFGGVRVLKQTFYSSIYADHFVTLWSEADVHTFVAQFGLTVGERSVYSRALSGSQLSAWFSNKGTNAEQNWLIENGISIAVSSLDLPDSFRHWRDEKTWMIDCDGLKDIEFQKVMPPWEAFQELSMWIGGVIAHPGRPTVQIESDKTKLVKHGFNKASFRKEKSGN
jgi:hypothetical protein